MAVGLITAGAAIAVMLTHRFTLKREKQASKERRTREYHFIATELIFMLERHVEQCARVATDDSQPNRERQHEYGPVTTLPELNLSAITGDWRVLDPLHMLRIRELPMLQDEANRANEVSNGKISIPLSIHLTLKSGSISMPGGYKGCHTCDTFAQRGRLIQYSSCGL